MEQLMRKPLLHYIHHMDNLNYSLFDDELKGVIREVGVRNMYIQNKLFELIGFFHHEGISAIVLKGAHLIHSIYPFGIRPIEDIDLLVEREDFYRVDQIIRSMGYEDCAVGLDMWTHLMFSNKMTYINTTYPMIPIDIHFSLGPHPYLGRISCDILFANTEILETPNGRLTVLQPEVLLAHLCLHLFQHHFEDWQVSCCDIITVIHHHQDKIDWEKFNHLVDSYNLSLPVNFSLQKARELAVLKIPIFIVIGRRKPNLYEKWIFSSSKKQNKSFDRYFHQFITSPGILLKLQGAVKVIAPGRYFLKLYHKGSYVKYVLHIIKTALKLT